MNIRNLDIEAIQLVKGAKEVFRRLTLGLLVMALAGCLGTTPKSKEISVPRPVPTENNITKEKTIEEMISYKMVFLRIPENESEASLQATRFIENFSANENSHFDTLFIFEPDPTSQWSEFLGGRHDKVLFSMFQKIKLGLGNKDLSHTIVVPFPEPNIPEWSNENLSAAQIAYCISHFGELMKYTFPTLKVGNMLNTMTYKFHSWSSGKYSSLVDFEKFMTSENVLGFQGFAWVDRDSTDFLKDPNLFLNAAQIIEAANSVGTKKIWINTGVPSEVLLSDKTPIYEVAPVNKEKIFDGIFQQVLKLKAAGLEVTINIFNENKLHTDEGINWATDPIVLQKFLNQLDKEGIKISLFQ